MLLGDYMRNDGFQAVSGAVCLKIKFRVRILTQNMLLSVWYNFFLYYSLVNVSCFEKQSGFFLSLIGQDKIPFDDAIYVCHFVNNELVLT